MRALKYSGVEWIGNIPAEWEMKRLKAIFLERKEKNDPQQTDFILSLGAAYGVVPYSEKEGGGNKAKEDLTAYRLAYPDDIVMNSMNIISGSVGISKYFGCVSPVYYMLYPRLEGVNQHYYCRMFQTKAFQRSLLGLGNGILMKETESGNFNTVRMRIPMEKLGVQLLPFPSAEEQKRIADFLDRKCAEIDTVIEKTKTTIEEYKKLKQSVITEAVTKGIRGDRAMQDSNDEWIGTIPSSWETTRLKNIATSFTKGNGITKEDAVEDGDTPCVRYGEIYSKYNQAFTECVTRTNLSLISAPKYFTDGNILFTCTGELVEEIGKSIVYLGKGECLAGGDIIILKHSQHPAFLNYALNSHYAQAQKSCDKTKLKVVHISASDIGNILLALPPIAEQKEIADCLDKKCAEIDTLIEKKTALLEEMESYKKSVIYEYVTGKKEVL